ncbi:unnamed protein product [Umbelopsis ramanniana]
MYVPNGTVRIQGLLKSPQNASISYYKERQKRYRGKKMSSVPTSNKVSKMNDDLIKKKDEDIKSMTAVIKQLTGKVRQAKEMVAKARIALQLLPKPSAEQEVQYQELVMLRSSRDDVLVLLLKEKQKLQMANHSKWLYIHDKNDRPGCEEYVEHINIGTPVQQSQQRGQEIIFGGTDYGLVTISTTTRMTYADALAKIGAYNRYSILANVDDAASTATTDIVPSSMECISSYRITAQELNQRSLNRHHEKKRNRRKKKNREILAAENQLAKSSMSAALSASDVLNRHMTHVKQRHVLRSFYYAHRACKESRTNELMNRKILDQSASKERRFVSQRESSKDAPKTIILCIGTAGTSVGSRIKGHAKRGGSKLRTRHQIYATVAMTNEFRTSQTCSSCFCPIVHPTQRKLVKDKWKKVSNNGTSVCVNPKCLRFQAGLASQNRDKQAAECMAISGSSLLLTGKRLACFENTSRKCTG